MTYNFELPEVGEGVIEAELVQWFVNVGDQVSDGQPICEIMTDKATMEINCPQSGLVTERCGDEGDVIAVHTKLIALDQSAQANAKPTAKAPVVEKANAQSLPPARKAPEAKPTPITKPVAPVVEAQRITPTKTTDKVLASPATRLFAAEKGCDLAAIIGTGKGGRITKEDVLRSLNVVKEVAVVETETIEDKIIAPPAIQASVKFGEDKIIKIVGLRRKIAEKMVESVQRAPHFTYVDEVDVTELVALRTSLKGIAKERGVKLTYIPFIMKALVSVFRQFPTVNAIMDEKSFSVTVRGEVNIGIATDTPQGLYVPVIKNVESKSILELAAEIADLTERTRNGKAKMHELQGGTFTLTSVGNIGGRFATPIINHPEVAILGVNQIHDRPMVINGEIVARKMMYLSPSFDHRILDGAVAARFTSALKAILENPAQLLLELR